ncbi:unnamed protein product [Chrysoparadoxa australica]
MRLALPGRLASRGRRAMATISYSETGAPDHVLRMEGDPDIDDLRPSEVGIKMRYAAINPSDIDQIKGVYGVKPKLPAVAGNEGMGEVIKVGKNVKSLAVGDWVIPMPAAGFGTWRNLAKASEDQVMKCPTNIPAEYAATIGVNPSTAYRMLHDFVKLEPGDVIIQNGCTSAVGLAVVQLAKKIGVTTINVQRARAPEDKASELVKALGGDILVEDNFLHTPRFYELISDLPPPKLALNCVSGRGTLDMARALGEGATLVTYGGMSGMPLHLDTSLIVDKGIKCEGFWITRWAQQATREQRSEMLQELANMMEQGELFQFYEKHSFRHFFRALTAYSEPFKHRKVLLEMEA